MIMETFIGDAEERGGIRSGRGSAPAYIPIYLDDQDFGV